MREIRINGDLNSEKLIGSNSGMGEGIEGRGVDGEWKDGESIEER